MPFVWSGLFVMSHKVSLREISFWSLAKSWVAARNPFNVMVEYLADFAKQATSKTSGESFYFPVVSLPKCFQTQNNNLSLWAAKANTFSGRALTVCKDLQGLLCSLSAALNTGRTSKIVGSIRGKKKMENWVQIEKYRSFPSSSCNSHQVLVFTELFNESRACLCHCEGVCVCVCAWIKVSLSFCGVCVLV